MPPAKWIALHMTETKRNRDSVQSQCRKIKHVTHATWHGQYTVTVQKNKMSCVPLARWHALHLLESRQHGQYSAWPQGRNAVLHGWVNASSNKMCHACMLPTRPDALHMMETKQLDFNVLSTVDAIDSRHHRAQTLVCVTRWADGQWLKIKKGVAHATVQDPMHCAKMDAKQTVYRQLQNRNFSF